jgi:hypothetical protein
MDQEQPRAEAAATGGKGAARFTYDQYTAMCLYDAEHSTQALSVVLKAFFLICTHNHSRTAIFMLCEHGQYVDAIHVLCSGKNMLTHIPRVYIWKDTRNHFTMVLHNGQT